MAIHYKLEAFEGPLDLLLHLIEKSEVDIYDISISEITDQYMEYLHAMQELELEITSEFLVMASKLLYMKSRMLLPKPPIEEADEGSESQDEEAFREQLIQKLVEYRKFKEIAEHLREREAGRSLIFTREPEDLSPFLSDLPHESIVGLHVADLILAFQKLMRKVQQREAVARVRRDEITIVERIDTVMAALVQNGGNVAFSRLFSFDATREEIVVTFLAVLELIKRKKIFCRQHHLFDDIILQLRDGEAALVG